MPVFTGPSFNILLPIISYYHLYTPSSCFSFPLNLFLRHPSICPPYQFNPLITNCFSLGPLYCSIPSPASPIFFPYLSLSSLLPPPLLPFPQHANHNGESTHREQHFYSLFHLNTLHTDCSNPPLTVTESWIHIPPPPTPPGAVFLPKHWCEYIHCIAKISTIRDGILRSLSGSYMVTIKFTLELKIRPPVTETELICPRAVHSSHVIPSYGTLYSVHYSRAPVFSVSPSYDSLYSRAALFSVSPSYGSLHSAQPRCTLFC